MRKNKKTAKKEGIVKFRQIHKYGLPVFDKEISKLNKWRDIFYKIGVIGMNQLLYNGAGYGNLSKKLEGNTFLITGTQTGGLERLTASHYTKVLEFYPKENLVVSEGPIEASSESMTHGAIYSALDYCNFVFHVHCNLIWKSYKEFDMVYTKKNVEYGTPEMVKEVINLFKTTNVEKDNIFVMLGHEDGVVSFGKTSDEAGNAILKYL